MDEEKVEYQFTGDVSSLKQATQTALSLLDKYQAKIEALINTDNFGPSKKATASLNSNINGVYKAVDKLEKKLKSLEDIKLPSGGAEAANLTQGLDSLSKALDSIHTNTVYTSKDVKATVSALKDAKAEFTSVGDGVDSLVQKELKFQATLDSIATKSDKVGNAIETAMNKMSSVFGGITSKLSAPFDAISAKLQSFKDRASDAMDRVRQVAEAAGSGFKRFKTDTEAAADDAEAAMKDYAEASKEAGDEAAEAAKKSESPFSKLRDTVNKVATESKKLSTLMGASLTKNARKASSAIETFKRAFGRIVLYKTIRQAISLVTEGLKEGIKNLYQYSTVVGTEFANSMNLLATNALYAKNSIAAMVAPIINSLAPAIDVLTEKFVALTNAIGKAFAALTGKSTFSQAVKYATNYEDAVKDATKAQKSFTAGFDELNIIEESSSGASKDQMDYGAMFEEVEVPQKTLDWAEKVRELFEGIANVVGSLAGVFDRVTGKLKNFFNILTGGKGATGVLEGLTTALNNLSAWIDEHADGLANLVIVLGALWGAFKILSGVSAIIGGVVGALSQLASLPATFAAIKTGIGALSSALAPIVAPLLLITGLVVAFGVAIADLWKTNEEFRDNVGRAWENITGVLQNAWDTVISPILSYIGETLSSLWSDTIEPVLQHIITILLKLWNDILTPLLNFFITNVGPVIVSAVKNIGNVFKTVFENIFGIIDGLLTALEGLIDFVAGVFTGDWDRALKGIKNVFIGVVNALLSGVETAVNTVVGGINLLLTKMLGAVQGVVDSILGGIEGLLDFIGFDISLPRWNDIPQIPYLTLPKIDAALATGGVVTGPTRALLGEGQYDEAVIPLGNSPQLEELVEKIGRRVDQGSGSQQPIEVRVYIGDREWDAFTYESSERGKKLVGAQPITTGG